MGRQFVHCRAKNEDRIAENAAKLTSGIGIARRSSVAISILL